MKPAPIRATTQEHLDILNIIDDLVLLKDGSAALILQTSAVNFDLLAEDEQEAVIYAYASLLNSLTFPIQIVVRSQKKDVSNYLKLLEKQESQTAPGNRQQQIASYRSFISGLVKEGNVLDKKFFCIIPFSRAELGLTANNPLQFKTPKTLPYSQSHILTKAKTSLEPKRDHLIHQFSRIGLAAKQLTTNQIITQLHNIYSPSAPLSRLEEKYSNFSTPIVQSASKI